MLDREKVMKGLGIVSRMLNEMGRRNEMDIVDDALAMLKDDETQFQYRDDHIARYQAEIKRLEALLKEQEADMIALKNAYKELAEKGSVIVRCKNCWKREFDNCPFYASFDYKPADDWFCADGERK